MANHGTPVIFFLTNDTPVKRTIKIKLKGKFPELIEHFSIICTSTIDEAYKEAIRLGIENADAVIFDLVWENDKHRLPDGVTKNLLGLTELCRRLKEESRINNNAVLAILSKVYGADDPDIRRECRKYGISEELVADPFKTEGEVMIKMLLQKIANRLKES